MKPPRYTDAARFRLPYVPAAQSRDSDYLAQRFAQYRELEAARAQEQEVVPLKRGKK